MKNFTLLPVIVFALAISPVFSQISVGHINSSSSAPNSDGVVYTLPRTIIKVDLVVRIDKHFKGPLSEYAERFYGIDDAINFDNTSYSIEDINISSITEPDPEQVYYIQPSNESSKEMKKLFVQLSESGYLISANNLDVELMSDDDFEQIVLNEDIEIEDGSNRFLIDSKIRAKVDTIIRKVVVDTIMTEKLFYRTRIIDKTNEELASEAMYKIDEIRDARYKLLTGFQETPYSAATIKYMDGELKKQEAEYLALFRGKTFTSYDQLTFYHIPESNEGQKAVNLFNFSSNTGVTKAGSSAGEKVMLNFETTGLAEIVNKYPKASEPEDYTTGIFYRIAEIVEVSLEWDDDVLSKSRVEVNQFGTIRNLNGNSFKIEMHPSTGGVKSVIIR